MKLLFDYINNGHSVCKKIEGKPILIFMGATGTGKSTAINYI